MTEIQMTRIRRRWTKQKGNCFEHSEIRISDLPALALRLIISYQASNSGLGQGFGFRG